MFTTNQIITVTRRPVFQASFTAARTSRFFSTSTPFKMPEGLTKQEVDSKTDPSVAKQWDDSTPTEQKFEDMYKIADGLKIGMLGSLRNGIGVRTPHRF